MATEYVEYNGHYTGEQIDSAIAKVGNLKPVATSGSYNDLTNKPTIPEAANDATLTIKKNGTAVGTFTADADTNVDINITVPTNASDVGALPASTKYAGASTAGGAATSASKLTVNAGSSTNPVYFTGGLPTPCTYNIEKSVPANAVFTDTTYESKSAASGGTAVSLVTTGEKYAWNNKQNALSSAQLNAVNSGIDSTKVAQIETNKNNISSLDTEIDAVANLGAKNLFDINATPIVNHTNYMLTNGKLSVSADGNWAHYTIPTELPEGDYILSMVVSGYSKASGAPDTSMRIRAATSTSGGTTAILETVSQNGLMSIPFTWQGGSLYIQFYSNYNGTSYSNSFAVERVMLRPASISDSTYQPYAMSNAELTAAIQAIQAQLANQ